MKDLELRTHYWDDPAAKAAFKRFILKIHGLDFSEWDSCGYWDHAYTPFSFFDGDTVVASVCIYLLDAVLNGENTRVAQISGGAGAHVPRRRVVGELHPHLRGAQGHTGRRLGGRR